MFCLAVEKNTVQWASGMIYPKDTNNAMLFWAEPVFFIISVSLKFLGCFCANTGTGKCLFSWMARKNDEIH